MALPGAGDPGQRPDRESAAKWILVVSPPRDRPSASRSHGLPAVAPPAARFLSFGSAPPASRDAQHGHGQPLRVDVLGRLVPGPGRVLVSADHCRVNRRTPRLTFPLVAPGPQPVQTFSQVPSPDQRRCRL